MGTTRIHSNVVEKRQNGDPKQRRVKNLQPRAERQSWGNEDPSEIEKLSSHASAGQLLSCTVHTLNIPLFVCLFSKFQLFFLFCFTIAFFYLFVHSLNLYCVKWTTQNGILGLLGENLLVLSEILISFLNCCTHGLCLDRVYISIFVCLALIFLFPFPSCKSYFFNFFVISERSFLR